ncbi:hypothetical protein [Halobacillus yeomjeoni]|uniref:Uncharacterized protein n=1 Tax=Halobacillus yeomjeoni TaxID=311194 RepID=A0A931HW75_9BACI|nr:hypothetical protein [Halobacillus yeomjeoni]MBH0230927.1 hypothetical protein [Halobacillus yeomjeoni]
MTDVRELIEKDGKRQFITGACLAAVSLIFIIGFFTYDPGSTVLAFLYGPLFAISGGRLIQMGYRDIQKAKRTERALKDDEDIFFDKAHARMYIGANEKEAGESHMYDMNKQIYFSVQEKTRSRHSLVSFFATFLSYGSIRPADYKMRADHGKEIYHLEKKGGFTWRGYVQQMDGTYVAYTKEIKNKSTGQKVYRYIEKNYVRWSAEGDPVIGHFTIKDQDGNVWAVMKEGAIPREAVDDFNDVYGSLIEWKKRDDIPLSLVAFLFLLQTRYR